VTEHPVTPPEPTAPKHNITSSGGPAMPGQGLQKIARLEAKLALAEEKARRWEDAHDARDAELQASQEREKALRDELNTVVAEAQRRGISLEDFYAAHHPSQEAGE
jgi:hypothetical protein